MKFGFSLIMRGQEATPEAFVAMAERAEALELDSLWCSDHLILPPQVKSGYVRIPGRKHPEHWKARYWEPVAVLGYLAARTRRVTLGTSVNILSMHQPIELAKQLAELDQLSGGRIVYGVGVGWFEEEFEVLGWNFKNRGARTDEALAMMKRLWSEDPVSFQGRFHQFADACFAPKPVQKPHPPIWIGGGSPAALKRAARFAQCWHPASPTYEALEAGRAALAELLAAEGRAADAVGIAVKCPLVFQDGPPAQGQYYTQGRVEDVVAAFRRFAELGVSHLVLDVMPETLTVALDTMERFAHEVRPRL